MEFMEYFLPSADQYFFASALGRQW
jgi:hypothetical protein